MLRQIASAFVALVVTAGTAAAGMSNTVVDVAADDERFETLVKAVKAAGLAETLSGDGPFTVFAPTDDAFAELPDGTLNKLLKPGNKDKLRAILTYHVVPAKVMAGDVSGKELGADTLNGAELPVDATGEGVDVAGANVIVADIGASNGVIHAIDSVVMPPEM